MKKKTFWGGLAILAGLYALRFGLKTAEELRRYNHIRSLSDDGTVADEAPELVKKVVRGQGDTLKEWMNFLQSAPKDLARYLKIETM